MGEEVGWEIAHFFRSDEEAQYTVRIVDRTGQPLAKGNPIKIDPASESKLLKPASLRFSDKSKAEMLRLSIAMGIAIVGLIAGARDQFMKLDTFFGLLAVLVLGFSADTIKNVFSKK